MVPITQQDQTMTSLQQVNEALGKVVSFLAPLMPLIRCHMVDYLTLQHWDTLLPTRIQHDLLHLPPSDLPSLPSASLPHHPNPGVKESGKPWDLSSSDLPTFLSQVCKHCPAALGVTSSTEQVLEEFGSAEISFLPLKGIMSHKKTHEVEVMGQVVARLAKGLDVSWLVDLGSGRGYLSSSLVLQYGQKVVAIDSSSSNTSSALARNNNIKRMWDNLTQTWQDQAEGRPVKKGKTRRKKVSHHQQQQTEQDNMPRNPGYQNSGGNGESLPSQPKSCFFGVTQFITEDTDLLEVVRSAVESDKLMSDGEDPMVGNSNYSESDNVSKNRDSRQPVDLEDASCVLLNPKNTMNSQKHTTIPSKNSISNTTKQLQDSSVVDTTCLVNETSQLGLIGLHTCGNLASSSLRLFKTNPKVNFVCNVGCCYHLLEEEYSKNTYNQIKTSDEPIIRHPSPVNETCVLKPRGEALFMIKDCNDPQSVINPDEQEKTDINDSSHESKASVILPNTEKDVCLASRSSNRVENHGKDTSLLQSDSEGTITASQSERDIDPLHPSRIPNLGYGFPLSSFLRERRFCLGRNARMLSSQAADRLTQGSLGVDGLYWRALLQVVLTNKLEDISNLPHVGRLSAKCQNFTEYTRAAMTRLGVSIHVTDEELEEYDLKYSSNKDRLQRFFLLRASLAAVVEGAMLLDRLAFLCEQEDVSAYLVPLFDPVTSPRCHALIAIRNTSKS